MTCYGLFLFGAFVALSSITGVVLNYSPVPHWDAWRGVIEWYMYAEQHWWASLWLLHNEHRLVFSRLIFWMDMRWAGGVNILSYVGIVVVCSLLALAMYRVAIYRADTSPAACWAIGGIVLAFCFSWIQNDNFTWAFQHQWFAVNLFALLAFHAMSVSSTRSFSTTWFTLALLAGLTSSLSMANGSITWLLLIALLLYWRFPLRFVVLTIITAAIEVLAYYWHAPGATGTLPHGDALFVIQHQPIDLVHYAILYLGAPLWFGFHRTDLAFVAGVLVIFGTAAGSLIAIRRRDLEAMPLLAYAAFACATALETGAGRLSLGLDMVFQSRYTTSALLAWIALLLFWMRNARPQTSRWPLYGATLVALVAIGIFQPAALRPDRYALFRRLLAGQAIREGVYDHTYVGLIFPDDTILKELAERARLEQLSILAPHALGYDDPPPQLRTDERCEGHVDQSGPTTTEGKSYADGWVFDQSSGTVPQTVVVTDADGNTIGNGVVGLKRTDEAAAIKTSHMLLGWTAFYSTTAAIRIFARIGEGRYCQIN
jgi:hypothetical protein